MKLHELYQEFMVSNLQKKNEKINDLGEELADVLFVLICLANQTGVDLEKAFDEKLKKKTKRDIDRHLSNDKLK